jgi:hypothetical protein
VGNHLGHAGTGITRMGRAQRLRRAALAVLLLGAGLATGVATSAANHNFSPVAPVVDGYIDDLYAGNFAEIQYRQDGGKGPIKGQISVIETADAYYVAFQQGLNYKSNAYCKDNKASPGCYQSFGALVGSDHISFTWPGLGAGGTNLVAGVDIISEDKAAGGKDANAYVGMVQKVRAPSRSAARTWQVSPGSPVCTGTGTTRGGVPSPVRS